MCAVVNFDDQFNCIQDHSGNGLVCVGEDLLWEKRSSLNVAGPIPGCGGLSNIKRGKEKGDFMLAFFLLRTEEQPQPYLAAIMD